MSEADRATVSYFAC